MLDDFRSRMGEVRQEIDRLTSQAEELERVVREQQVRLEEMDLLVRQRDDQLAEQQARVEELEKTLDQQNQEIEQLRALLAEREETLSCQEKDLEDLRAQLAQREATESALREELTRARAQLAERVEEIAPAPDLLGRLSTIEDMLRRQGKVLTELRSMIKEETARLHSRLDRLEAGLAVAPLPIPVAAPRVEEAALVEEAAPAAEAPPAPAEVAAPPPAVAVEDPLQALLYETLESLPAAKLVGLAGLDGLGVEVVTRMETRPDQRLEIELADLTVDAARIASALGAGPLLTLAFQVGQEDYLVSPIDDDYFAFLLTPADSMDEFRRAQAVLLQAASRLREF